MKIPGTRPDEDKRPSFDVAEANKLLGKHVIIGLTYMNSDRSVDRQEQEHGVVTHVDRKDGIAVKVAGREELLWLPPDLRSWKIARPGEYRLRSTGEVVTNPDFTTDWVINAGKERANPKL